MSLIIKNLNKQFGENIIFRDFNISFREGERTCILGPSGCGKTTLLNIIGGITEPDSGSFEGFEGKSYSYVFQEPRLLPWKTVTGNIEFVLSDSLSRSERTAKAKELIERVELERFASYYPSQLSGGMSRRVAIARAFATDSDIILMDEPLAGLDTELKHTLMQWFSDIWKRDKPTVLFVTHDESEAHLLGNEIYRFSKAPVSIIS